MASWMPCLYSMYNSAGAFTITEKLMTQQPVTDYHTENVWRVEALRLSAFFVSSSQVDPSNWWETVVGDPPENRNVQPKAGTRQEEGPYGGGRLILTVQPNRADWLFVPAFDQQTGGPAFDQLPLYDAALGTFLQITERWLETSSSLSRLAFGAILDIPVQDRPTGYRQLTRYLRNVQIDPDNSSDFLYQINHPRESKKTPGLLINRLSKWAVALAKFSQVAMGPTLLEYIISGDERCFARLELDINTAPERQVTISEKQLPSLFSELVELATEIAIRGDVP